jgi:hypothetical protein
MPDSREIAVYNSPDKEHFELAQRQANAYAGSTLVPESMRTRENCLAAIMMADEMGESRLSVLQNIFFVHGRPGWITAFMVARANRSGKLKGRIRWKTTGAGETLAVEAYADLADGGADPRVSVTVDYQTAVASGWTTYKDKQGKIQTHARWDLSAPVIVENQLVWRSGAWLIRRYLPEVMVGLPTREELDDISGHEMVDVTPPPAMPKLDDFAEPKAAHQASGRIPTSPEPSEEPGVPAAALPGDPPLGEPDLVLRRRRVPRNPKSTEAQRAFIQAAVESVLHEPEPAELDPAPIEEPLDYEPEAALPPASVVVMFDPEAANAQEWFSRARPVVHQMLKAESPPRQFAAFRKANLAPMMRLKQDYFRYWQEIDGLLKSGEQ